MISTVAKNTHDFFEDTARSMTQPAIGIAILTCQSLGGHCPDQTPTEPERQRHSRSAIDRTCWVGRNSTAYAGVSLHVTVIATSSIRSRTGNYKITMKSVRTVIYRNLLVGNLEKLAKNRQVCLICHINVKRNQETSNRQTGKVL